MRRQRIFSVIVPCGTVLLVLLLAELALRLLPVSSSLQTMPVDAGHPVLHFTPNRPVLYSLGWDMHRVVRGRVNNAGFLNEQDYSRAGALPLLAIVGDSFIEAKMVPYAQTLQGRLARRFGDRLRVYSFGASGAPLSQYLIWAGYAVREYGARAVVINVVINDFDESLLAYKDAPGFWYYAPDATGTLRLRLVDYQPGLAVSIARHSALLRYLLIDLHASGILFTLRQQLAQMFGKGTVAMPAAESDVTPNARRVRDSLAAIDASFRDLPEQVGLPPDRIMFTVDGFRYQDAAERGQGSYFDIMRKAFLQKAAALGYEAVDLDTRFLLPPYKGQRFDFPDDGHWNAAGHGVAADAVASSRLIKRMLQ